MEDTTKYLRRREAADYLKARFGFGSTAWLAKLAVIGGGPVYVKNGSMPLYTKAELDQWMMIRTTRRASTSQIIEDNPTAMPHFVGDV